ncbi:flavin reductase family protein [Streptomyces sp. DT2A-34]|uniref:flavin reductase family protein n=1 Tax=Streptomyces sp. DT2A-34 TaxID=3051182 RepID=UPI00265C402C|nr:flavin reductase family protein [Streptomyces sp. DT2A-34]MDO0916659.1 flavin reductase family protein [Streptomyces sp. DT2A-34]
MASFPSGVTVVTTTDAAGQHWGFTATSFCSLSMSPPLVLVCLANSAECHPVFSDSAAWIIHILPKQLADVAMRFATRGIDKFADTEFRLSDQNLPVIANTSATLHCTRYSTHDGGDHTIFVGQVDRVEQGMGAPAVYFRREFHSVGAERQDH